jgi:hypothetical protein
MVTPGGFWRISTLQSNKVTFMSFPCIEVINILKGDRYISLKLYQIQANYNEYRIAQA